MSSGGEVLIILVPLTYFEAIKQIMVLIYSLIHFFLSSHFYSLE